MRTVLVILSIAVLSIAARAESISPRSPEDSVHQDKPTVQLPRGNLAPAYPELMGKELKDQLRLGAPEEVKPPNEPPPRR